MNKNPLAAAAAGALVAALALAGVASAQQMTAPGAGMTGPNSAPSILEPTNTSSTSNTSTPATAPLITTPSSTPTTTTTNTTTEPAITPILAPSTTPSITPSVMPSTTPTASSTGSTAPSSLLAMPWPPVAPPEPAVLSVTGDGDVLIRGMVVAVNNHSIILRSWGGEWTISASAGASITPSTTLAGQFAAFRVGDYVGAIGVVLPDQNLSVAGSIIRDWTLAP